MREPYLVGTASAPLRAMHASPFHLPSGPRLRILVVEDDEAMRQMLADALVEDGHHVEVASTGTAAIARLRSAMLEGSLKPQVLVTDLRMPGTSGLQTIENLRRIGCEMHVFLMTAFGSEEVRAAAERLGVLEVFDKPFRVEDLRDAVRRIDLEV